MRPAPRHPRLGMLAGECPVATGATGFADGLVSSCLGLGPGEAYSSILTW